MPQWFNKTVKSAFGLLGLDVRFRHRLKEYRRREAEDRHREPWRFVRNYGIRTVIDVGANVGQFALLMAEFLPGATILSFEPLSDCFAALKAALVTVPNTHCFQVALGRHEGRLPMYRSAFSPSSSLLRMEELHKQEAPYTAEASVEEIEITTADRVLSAWQPELAAEILVKMDVQGYTEAVIEGASQTLARTRLAIIEASCYPLYQGEALFGKIHDMMRDRGFTYRGNVDQWISQHDYRVLAVDAIFEKVP